MCSRSTRIVVVPQVSDYSTSATNRRACGTFVQAPPIPNSALVGIVTERLKTTGRLILPFMAYAVLIGCATAGRTTDGGVGGSPPPPPPPSQPPDDHGDRRGSATAVAVPSDTGGVLTAGDTDYFGVSVTGPGLLQVYTSGRTDTTGHLENIIGSPLASDDDSGRGLNFHIEHDASAGFYFIRVAGSSDSTGDYTLHVRFSALPPPDDHGDTRDSATAVAVPSDTAGALTAGDADYFRISVSDSGSLQVYTSGGLDTTGRLEDASGSPLATDTNAGQGSNFRVERDVTPGTYYVRVTNPPGSTAGNYTLHVRFSEAPDHHGDSRGSATAVDVPSDTAGALVVGDTDYFRIRVDTSGSVQVYTSGNTDTLGRTESASGSRLVTDSSSGQGANFHIEHYVTPGTYYVRVTGQSGGTVGHYTLHVRFVRDDHGYSRDSATTVGVPSDTEGALTAGDTDYFRVNVNGSGSLQVYTSGGTDTLGFMEDASGSRLAVDHDSGQDANFRIEQDVTSGTYYIQVTAQSSWLVGNYTLHVRFTASLPPDDHGDSRDSATAVAISSNIEGVLTAGDADYFRISVTGSGSLQVTSAGGLDTTGHLEDASGSLLATDTDSGQGANFRIERDVAPGTYYVRVTGQNSSTAGNYTLRVRFFEFSDDHGNSRDSATVVPVPSDIEGVLTPGDTDYFRISVSGSGSLQVFTTSGLDTTGYLEDASGSTLATDTDSGQGVNFRIEHEVSSGTYYVRVVTPSQAVVGIYTLHMRFSEPSPPHDHGDSHDSATAIALPSDTAGVLAAGDTDYFRFSVPGRGWLEVYTSGNTDTIGSLESEVLGQLARDDNAGQGVNFRIEHDERQVHFPRTYYVRVTGRSSSTTGSYTLHVRFTEDDHGDGRGTATPIAVPSDTAGELTPDDRDYFRINVRAPGSLHVYTSGLSVAGALEDTRSSVLVHRVGQPNVGFRHDVSPGVYFVRIYDPDDRFGAYTLHVRFSESSAPPPDDHGDGRGTATPIAVPSDTAGELTPDDRDYFRIDVSAPGSLQVYTSGNTDTIGFLFRPTGSDIARDSNSGEDSNFRFEDDVSAGTYYIVVAGQSGSEVGSYTLHIRFSGSSTPPADDHGESRNSATVVAVPSDTAGVLTAGDTDYFTFNVSVTGSVHVYTSGNADTTGLLENARSRLATDADSGQGGNFRIERDVPPGTYFVQVTGQSSSTTGSYTLHVRFSESPAPPADDHGDSRESATTVAVPSDTTAVLTAGDTDYFRISVRSNGLLELYTSGNTDTTGSLENSQGSELAADTNSGQGPNFRIEYYLYGGTSYIRVTGQSSSTAGNYTLHVRFSEDDHGDNRDSATAVAIPSDTAGVLYAGDTDYFRISVSRAGFLQVYTTGNTDVGGLLADASGSPLGADNYPGQGPDFRMERDVSPDTYYVRVMGRSLSAAGNYTLHVRFSESPAPPADDHGDSRESATTVAVPSDTTAVLTAGDTDYFRISVRSNGLLELYTSGNTDTTGSLENSQGSELAADTNSGQGPNFRIEYYLYGGTSYIRVTGQSSSTAGNYTLHVRFSEDDHGDNRDSATAVAIPSDTAGVLYAGDTDYFRISVSRAGFLQVYTTGNTDVGGLLADASGSPLGADNYPGQGPDFRMERDVSPDTYYVRVMGRSLSAAGNYTLHVRFSESPAPPADDHGDSRDSATTVGIPSDTAGVLTAGDTDYFRISVSRSGSLQVYTSGNTDTTGRLDNSSGSQMATDSDSGQNTNFRIERSVTPATYYFRVTGQSGSTAGNYMLHVRFSESSTPSADDHGDSRDSATTVAVPSDTAGELTAGDTDYFRIIVSGSGSLLVSTSGRLDTTGRLENASGSELASDTDSGLGTNFGIEHYVEPGTYYLRVTGQSSSTAGSYTFYVRFLEDDHGNSENDATRVGVPSDTAGVLTAGDTDYFRFVVVAPGTLQVYTTGSTDTTGFVENDSVGLSLSDDDAGDRSNFRIERDVVAGTYYVRVTGQSSSTAGIYTLHVRLVEDNHGDSLDDATGIGIPSDTAGVLTAGDTDYFRVVVGRSGTLQVYTSGGTDTKGRLEDDFGPTLTFSDDDSGDGSNFRIERSVVVGTYYIRVTGYNSSTVGEYTLHVRFQDPDDHGDSRNVATGVGIPSETEGVLTAGDTDYFRIIVGRSGTLQVYTSGGTDTKGRLEDNFGPTLTFSDDDSGDGSNFRIERSVVVGTYFIQVNGQSSSTAGNYTLHVRLEHGDSRSVAYEVGVPSDTAAALTADDTDYFEISVAHSGTLQVYTNGNIDTLGRLENSSGSVLASDDDSGEDNNFRIEHDVSVGTYYVRVTGYRSSTTGNYSLHVALVAGVTVADARVLEGRDAELQFVVALDAPATHPVTVTYETADGSAQAGTDYLPTAGALIFQTGESKKTITVAVLDDSHDEGEETLRLKLLNALGARLADAEGTGTIRNRDPLPRAFLARFGRTAAAHVVERVEERLRTPRAPGLRGRFAGRELRPGMERDLARSFLSELGISPDEAPGERSVHDPLAGSPTFGWTPRRTLGMAGTGGPISPAAAPVGGLNSAGALRLLLGGGDLLTNSGFSMNRQTRQGGILSMWSGGASSQFAGDEGTLSLGGDVRTTMIGADYAQGPVVAGLSLSHSRGAGEYAAVTDGRVTSAVTGLFPWVGYQATDRVAVWGLAGYGRGQLRLRPDRETELESPLSMAMAAAGTRTELVTRAGGVSLAFKADALWVGTTSAGVDGPAGRLEATEAVVTRFRSGFEGSNRYTLAGRMSVTPSVELALRHDGGDAETGSGLDLGTGLVVSDVATGLSFDLRVRTLLVHQAEGFRERGMALSLSYNPTPSTPLGLVARVAPSWGGQATRGADALWGQETMAGLAHHGSLASGTRLDAEIGYGLPVGNRFVGTPRFVFGTSEYGRDYRLGYRLRVLDGGSLNFELGVDAQRQESALLGGAITRARGQGTLRW